MVRQPKRQFACAKIVIVVAMTVGLATAGHAACYPPESRLPQNQIQSFLDNPAGLLASNPRGGGPLELSILKLVASDNAALPAVIKLLSSANTQQRAAIGSGLAAAAQVCLATDQAFAGQIQTAIVEAGDRVALTAFVSSGGQQTATAAIGPGADGATAFVSGTLQVTGNSNNNNTPFIQPIVGGVGGTNFFTFNGGMSPTAAARSNSP
jgi:hypothetical protein